MWYRIYFDFLRTFSDIFFFPVLRFLLGKCSFWGALGMRLKGAGRIGPLHALSKHGDGDGNTCALAELPIYMSKPKTIITLI